MSNHLDIDKHIAIAVALRDGLSIREVCAKLDVARATVNSRRKMLVANGVELKCECGRPAGHNGWCPPKYARSPKRQAFIKSWNRERSKSADGKIGLYKAWYEE